MGYFPKKVKRRAHSNVLRLFASLSVMGAEFREHWFGGLPDPLYMYYITMPDGQQVWAWSPRQAILKACKKLGVK